MQYRCRECFRSVASDAATCPHCGVTFEGTIASPGGCLTYVPHNLILAMDIGKLVNLRARRKPE